MRVTITATKKWGYTTVAGVFILLSALLVYAFQSGQSPSVFGHSSDEIQFNITYPTPSPFKVCAMSSYETIPGTNGTTYCSLTAYDDDSTVAATAPACDVRRRTDGLWEYQFNVGCGAENCIVSCVHIN